MLDISAHLLNELFPQTLERNRVRIEMGDLLGQLVLPHVRQPFGEVVVASFESQPGLEDMKIDRIDADLLEDIPEFLEVMRLIRGRKNERPTGHEMELLTFRAITVSSLMSLAVRSQDFEVSRPQVPDRRDRDRIDAGQSFAEVVEPESIGHPESEIVGG